MWGALLGSVASSLLGGVFASRSASRARREAVHDQVAADVARSDRERALRAEAGRIAQRERRIAMADFRVSRRMALRDARAEREQVYRDDLNRFLRLRQAADKAGFNPLTLLDSGYLGSDLPTTHGSLPIWGGMPSGIMSTAELLGISGDGQNLYNGKMQDSANKAQASQAAFDGTFNAFSSAASLALEAARVRSEVQIQSDTLDINRAGLALDRERFDWDRSVQAEAFSLQRQGMALDASRLAAWGNTDNARMVKGDGLRVVGQDWATDTENMSGAQDVQDRYGDGVEFVYGIGTLAWDAYQNASAWAIRQAQNGPGFAATSTADPFLGIPYRRPRMTAQDAWNSSGVTLEAAQ